MNALEKLGEIGGNFLDIIDATSEGWAANTRSNYTADEARALAIASSVDIARAKAMGEERRKDEMMQLLKTVLIILGATGLLTVLLTYLLKAKKK